jgi:hypothetical protein
VRERRFAVYPIRTIDEGISLLTGTAHGDRGADGRYPGESVNGRVERRIAAFAELAGRLAALAGAGKEAAHA